jgi:hypothetical protein
MMKMGHTHSSATVTTVSGPTELVKTAAQKGMEKSEQAVHS